MNKKRVVITGMGVLAPNAHGLTDFETALRHGISGIRFQEKLKELNFACQVAGVPQGVDSLKQNYLDEESLLAMNSAMIFSAIAAIDCWLDAGFKRQDKLDNFVDWDTGAIIGTGIGGVDTICERVGPMIDQGKVKRLGSTMVEQTMASSCSANIAGILALGNQVTTNSSACCTGTEAIIEGYYSIISGRSKRMLAGAAEAATHYIWGTFDAMRVLARNFNDSPEHASRPMSASACGFVPGSGAGILMLEELESAQKRGARIYAEIIAAETNCGGQRNGGSISAPNPEAVQRCIQKTIRSADIHYQDIDLINGHLTATMADPLEIKNWQAALGCPAGDLPAINSTKSLIGHALGAAGGIECVASVLQLYKGFLHKSLNCEDLHPQLEPFYHSVVGETRNKAMNIVAKASFGFGDVNSCLLFKRFES